MGMFDFFNKPPKTEVASASRDEFESGTEFGASPLNEEQKRKIGKWEAFALSGLAVFGVEKAMAGNTNAEADTAFVNAYKNAPTVILSQENQILSFAENIPAQKEDTINGVKVEKKGFGLGKNMYARVETHGDKVTSLGIKVIGEKGTQTVFYDSEYTQVDSTRKDDATGAFETRTIPVDGKVNMVELRNSKGETTAKYTFEDQILSSGETVVVIRGIDGKEGDRKVAFTNAQEAFQTITGAMAEKVGEVSQTASN